MWLSDHMIFLDRHPFVTGGGSKWEMRDPYSLSVSLSLLYAHQPGANLRLRASIGLSLTIIQSVTYQSFLCTACARGRERASGEGKGGVVVDNVCKFVREHPALCNKYTVLFCLLLCVLIHSSLSSTPVRFFFFSKYPSNLHPPSFALRLFTHPSMHPSLPWLTVVSCREAVNNSSGWVVLPFPAPHFWLAVVLKNVWWCARNQHTYFHQGFDQ